MIQFLRNRRVGKGKNSYISDMSKIAKEEREKILRERVRGIILEELEVSGVNKRIDDVFRITQSIDKKLENLKSSLVPLSRSKTDSMRKIKIKRLIIEYLKKHKRASSYDLSAALDLSRTRCSEYLKELERSGITKGIVVSRQRIYELDNQ